MTAWTPPPLQVIPGAWRVWEALGGAAKVLRRYLTTPTASCVRLVRMGGSSCVRRLDGDKVIEGETPDDMV